MKKPGKKTKQITLQLPDDLQNKIEKRVDGIRFRSLAQLVSVILLDWLEEQERKK